MGPKHQNVSHADEVKRIATLIGNGPCTAGNGAEIDLFPWGSAELNLAPADDAPVDWGAMEADLRTKLPLQGHGFAHAENRNDRPVNALILTMHSLERDTYLRTIYLTMKEAAKRQLSGQRPGMLCIHIPEIRDFASLIDESGLRAMTAYFFSKPEHAHVYAVA